MKKPGRKADIWSMGILILEMKSFPNRPSFIRHSLRVGISTYMYMKGLLGVGYPMGCNRVFEEILGDIDTIWSDKDVGNIPNIQKCIVMDCLEKNEEKRCTANDIITRYEKS